MKKLKSWPNVKAKEWRAVARDLTGSSPAVGSPIDKKIKAAIKAAK